MSFGNILVGLAAFALAQVLTSTAVRADSCSSVIAGASGSGYQGPMGGYDANGLCHRRDISENDCRRLAGSLFYGWSSDGGKGFSHCAFRYPPSQGSQPGGQRGGNDYSALCNSAIRDFQRAIGGRKCPPVSLSVDCIITFSEIQSSCPHAGRANVVPWARQELERHRVWAEQQSRQRQQENERRRQAEEAKVRWAQCIGELEAARSEWRGLGSPSSKAKSELIARLRSAAGGICAEWRNQTCETCVTPWISRAVAGLSVEIEQDRKTEAAQAAAAKTRAEIERLNKASDAAASDAARNFNDNDAFRRGDDPFTERARQQGRAIAADAAANASRDIAANDPTLASENPFQAAQRRQAKCGSDIDLGAPKTPRPADCDRTGASAPGGFSYKPKVDHRDLARRAQADCRMTSMSLNEQCVQSAKAKILVQEDTVVRSHCGGQTPEQLVLCANNILVNGITLLASQCPGGNCLGTASASPSGASPSPAVKAAQQSKSLRDTIRDRMRKKAAARQEFLTDMEVLKSLAEQMSPDDPARAAVIRTMDEQLKPYGIDVIDYFRRYDEANTAPQEHRDAFEETRARWAREAEAAREKAAWSDADQKYCHDSFLRVQGGNYSLELKSVQPGPFMAACRTDVIDSRSALATGTDLPSGGAEAFKALKDSGALDQRGARNEIGVLNEIGAPKQADDESLFDRTHRQIQNQQRQGGVGR